jgi:hypothetical protein
MASGRSISTASILARAYYRAERERQMTQWDFTGQPPGQEPGFGEYDEYGEFHEFARPVRGGADQGSGYSDDFDGGAFSPISWERDPQAQAPPMEAPPMEAPPMEAPPWAPAPRPSRSPRSPWPDESWPPRVPRGHRRRLGGPRWLLPAALVAVVLAGGGTAAALLAAPSGHPSASGTPAAAPTASAPAAGAAGGPGAAGAPAAPQPLTLAQAKNVLAAYTSANNTANAKRSDTLLGSVETGSSYAIDAGIYRVQQADKAAPYPAFAPQRAQFYIPGEPVAEYPHWFAVQVLNADLASPGKVTGTEYLVFTQAAPGAPWLNTFEPYVLAGAATPLVPLGADDLATSVDPQTTSLTVMPAQIPALTAASLDGAQAGAAFATSPGNLADRLDQAFWKQRLPTATVTDRHAATAGYVFALRTADGGALVFYTDSAELTMVPPAGEALHLTIPGFYSPGQALRTAGVGYLEQFAAYVPPVRGSGLRIVADYSGITAKS